MTHDFVYGNYTQPSFKHNTISELSVRFVPLDLVAHWRRCGLTADFLAHFVSYNFSNREAALNVISTVLNELLENSVKFSLDKARHVNLVISHYDDILAIETVNITDGENAEKLNDYVQKLVDADADRLFVEQIEHTANLEREASGVGLITLRKDYGATIGVKIASSDSDHDCYEVAVQVRLNAEEVDRQ